MFFYPKIKFSVLLIKRGLLVIVFAALSIIANAQNTIKTGITGIVTDDKGLLPGVAITVLETKQVVISGNNGDYFVAIKPGEYTVEFRFIGLKSVSRRLIVGPQQLTRLNVSMVSDSRMLGTVSVSATRKATTQKALLEQRRQSTNIQDAIGAVQMDKSASITTAQALQRVTGVTVKDGKYITVRGLSDRNIVVQLNGSRLAGADASRSSVAVDLIPAQLLENITVEKSITPDKPGDANGAVVEIQTKTIPDNEFLFLSAQTGLNGNIGLYGSANSFEGANMGFFGQNVKKLELTNDYKDLIADYTARGFSPGRGTIGTGLTQAIQASAVDQAHYNEALRINRVMDDGFSPFLTTRSRVYSPDQIYGLSYGNKYMMKGGKVLGLVLGVNYYNRSLSNPNGVNNLYTVKEPVISGSGTPNINYPNELRMLPLYNLNENTGNQQLNYGGLATLSFRFNKFNEVSFTYNGNFGTETNASLEDGISNAGLKVVDPSVLPFFRIISTSMILFCAVRSGRLIRSSCEAYTNLYPLRKYVHGS